MQTENATYVVRRGRRVAEAVAAAVRRDAGRLRRPRLAAVVVEAAD